jgi:predicted MFS family arabinose efflux permease
MMLMARGFLVDMAGRNVLGFAYGCAIVSAFSMGCGAVPREQSGRKYMESKSYV